MPSVRRYPLTFSNRPAEGPVGGEGHRGSLAKTPAAPGFGSVSRALLSLRGRMRGLLIVERTALIVAALLGLALTFGAIDALLRLPRGIRAINLVAGLALLGFLIWRFLLPAIRFRPSLTSLALRLERSRPELRGRLASAVDFSDPASTGTDAATPVARALADRVIDEAARTFRPQQASGLLSSRRAARAGGAAAATLAAVVACAALTPAMFGIGARRLLMPWTGAEWPKRTAVADVTNPREVHPMGKALPLQASLLRSPRDPHETDVTVQYRFVDESGRAGASRRELLTFQNRPAPASGERPAGELFERLIDPQGGGVEYRFTTADDETPWRRVRFVPPPAVKSASVTVTPPAYAERALAAGGVETGGPIELGPGTDDRAVLPSTLAGSRIEWTIELTKPARTDAPLASLLAGADPAARVENPTPTTIRAAFTLGASARVPVRLIDEFGIESVDDAVYRLEAITDAPPAATITQPPADRAVLPSAVVAIAGEGRDDVGLRFVSIERQTFRPEGRAGGERSGPGGALAPSGDPVEAARVDVPADAVQKTTSARTELDLAPLALRPGDEVRVTALAGDLFATPGGDGAPAFRAPTRSSVRTLRIIGEADFVSELRRQLAEVRQAAIRIDQQQAETAERTGRQGAASQPRRGQAQISERLARQAESVQRIAERVEENRLSDQTLRGLLDGARQAVAEAGKASSEAARTLDEAAARHEAAPPDRREPQPGEQRPRPEAGEPSRPQGESDRAEQQGGRRGGRQGGDQAGQPAGEKRPQAGDQGPSGPGGEAPKPPQEPQQADPQPQEPTVPLTENEGEQARKAQERVREELSRLISLLDRGEDAWAVRNGIERALRDQQELSRQTRAAGQQTAGKTPEQLSPQEKSDLQKIVERQQQLAEQTRQMLREMRQKEQQLRQSDPAASMAVQQARERGEQQQVSQAQQSAAQQAGQNQMQQAGQQQARAEQALEQMLQDMARGERNREQILRRMLSSLIQSIEQLIERQKDEIAALEKAQQAGDYSGLDRGMIALNTNTLAVVDLARGGGAQAAPVTPLLQSAADAQGRAIRELRKPAGELEGGKAREHEVRSLDLLTQARDKARELDKQMERNEQRRRQAELRRAFRDVLDAQLLVRAETETVAKAADAAGGEVSRRDRAELRRIGERQGEVRTRMDSARKEAAGIEEAKVVVFAIDGIDADLGASAERLAAGEPRPAAARQDSAIATLRDLIDALGDPSADENDQKFNEGERGEGEGGGGGAGGQGQNQLVPPLKELRLLRKMQQGVAARTVELDAAAQADGEGLKALAARQRELADLARDLVDRLNSKEPPANFDPAAPGPKPGQPKEPQP
ncbi:MAG: hypothetical protein IBJ11_03480 [Phycisphaerales bacterium]|nr:hypothetical protein [Phycisphaerales bacterium]